ncbi:hypothetical protein EXIGLDRAFT_563691, partial [Exidia glandulosa HHB12029]
PPAWCRLPTDVSPTLPLVERIPERIQFDETARCRCGSPGGPCDAIVIQSTVYASTRATAIEIEVKPCSTCRPEQRMFAGPDLRALGLFNFNNKRIYTHELLNKFTNSITAHETPFHAFRTVIQRTYMESECRTSFVSDDAFRTAWFSFTRIQDLGDSFQCDVCGPNPEVVIFDGVTASFSNKHQTSSLCPPTLIQPDAPKRLEVQ